MNRIKKVLIPLFFILSLGLMMGQDGFCFFAGDADGGAVFTGD